MTMPCEQSQSASGPDFDLAAIDELLRAVVADGFTVYLCGGSECPEAIVATYAWSEYVDFVVIKDMHDVTAARARQDGDWDVFAPESVVWSYQGHARWALRAVLDLVHPDHPDAPDEEYPAPESARVDPEHLRTISVRAPKLGTVSRRATRLEQAIPR